MSGQGDVVRAYVDAFRAKGLAARSLLLGLGQHRRRSRQRHGHRRAQMDYVKTQLTELLTNYGPIPILIFDGWSWKMGHNGGPVPGDPRAGEVAAAGLPDARPHATSSSPWDDDIAELRGAAGHASSPADNTFPPTQKQKINAARRQRLVLGAQHRQPDDASAPSSTEHLKRARAAVDELPAQLPAQPRRPADAGDRHAPGRGRRGLEPERVAPAAARAARRRSTSRTRRRRDRDQRHRRATRSTASTTTTGTRSGRSRARCRSRSRIDLGRVAARRRHARLRARATSRSVGASTDGAITSYAIFDQHRRHDVHRGDDRRPGRRTAR